MGTVYGAKMNEVCPLSKEIYNLVLARDDYRLMRLNFIKRNFCFETAFYSHGVALDENIFWNFTSSYCHALSYI